jgi:hypothetical protein
LAPNSDSLESIYIAICRFGLSQCAQTPDYLEAQGLGPLCYRYAADMEFPAETKRALQGLYLRHRRANQVRVHVLREVLVAYEAVGIEVLALKGAALAHLVYPEPGLRPMRDLDLLVKPAEARRAQELLLGLGFQAPLPGEAALPDKHLSAALLQTDDLLVSIEIHHNLFNAAFPASMTLADLTGPPLPFALDGVTAYTLGYEDMLWHLCQHLTYHTSVWELFRLVWVADIVAFAGRFAAEIDWERVAVRYPLILNTLSSLHFMVPLPEQLRAQAPLRLGRSPQGLGQDFAGWPRASLAELRRQKGYRHIVRDTFYPSEWWLRLRYGLGSARPLFAYRWLWHPLHIVGWICAHLLEQASRRRIKGG